MCGKMTLPDPGERDLFFMKDENISIIILAAGASTRLGTPKQLLKFEDKTLLTRIAETALSTDYPTIVVLGAYAGKIMSTIKALPVKILINKSWKVGVSSSISTGLETLRSDVSAVILLLCDQPFITSDTILRLVKRRKKTGKSIVASEYKDTIGTPALFTHEIFKELMELENDRGAKPLIKKYRDTRLATISAPEAAFDIDKKEDLNFIYRVIAAPE